MSIFMSMTVNIGHNHEHEHDHNHVHGIHLWYGRVEHVHLMAIVNPIREASDHQVFPKFLNHENNISLDHVDTDHILTENIWFVWSETSYS